MCCSQSVHDDARRDINDVTVTLRVKWGCTFWCEFSYFDNVPLLGSCFWFTCGAKEYGEKLVIIMTISQEARIHS